MEKVVIQREIFQTLYHVVENTLRDLMRLFMMLFKCLDFVRYKETRTFIIHS